MQSKLSDFGQDETGAVTVDWVVLTAAIVGLGFVVLLPIAYTTDNSATTIAGGITDTPIGYPSP